MRETNCRELRVLFSISSIQAERTREREFWGCWKFRETEREEKRFLLRERTRERIRKNGLVREIKGGYISLYRNLEWVRLLQEGF